MAAGASVHRGAQFVRQWRLLRALEGAKRGMTAAQLKDAIEETQSTRTLYRDLEVLDQAGFPLTNEGGRWRLLETSESSWAIPVNPTEVVALMLTEDLLEQEGFVAIAPDGSLAVTHKKLEPSGSRVEVWDLATERLLRTRVFENGAGRFLMAKGAVLLVESDPPSPPGPPMPPRSIAELPIVDTTLWNLQSDQLRKVRGFDPHPSTGCRFSSAGLRLACANWRGLSWRDFDHPQWDGSIVLAPEWKEPRTDVALTYKSKPQAEPPWTSWESLAWTGDGNRIVLAYARLGDSPECRLERWTLGDKANTGKGSDRLATVHRRCNIKVLAASRDGNRFVTSEYPSHLVLRQAPKYEAIEIAPVDATQAAFLPGDERFVTVHRDGLQLWDAQTLGLLAKWP